MKEKKYFVCSECGFKTTKWAGRCPQCGAWNSFVEKKEEKTNKILKKDIEEIEISSLFSVKHKKEIRFSSGISEFDRVLGGGLVRGEVVLLGGEPGIGKSTILLQVAEKVSSTKKVLYVSGEESIGQIKLRAERLGLKGENILILSTNSVEEILAVIEKTEPELLIVDSIQTIFFEGMNFSAGSVAQIREVASKLIEISKKNEITTFIIGHITKGGEIAGPKILEHLVDAVLYFEGDRFHQGRILRAIKNRFGASFEIGLFEITSKGLIPLDDPFNLWNGESKERESGISIFAAIEGSRPLLVEIQSLVTKSPFMGNPRRMFAGVDRNRATMLIAVMEKKIGIKFYEDDVFVKVSGGLNIQDPAIDLALAASLISSKIGIKIDKDSIFIGEISLGGKVMPPFMLEARLSEAIKFGFKNIYTSDMIKEIEKKGINIHKVRNINQLRNIFNIDNKRG